MQLKKSSLRSTGAAGIAFALMLAGIADAVTPFALFVSPAQARVGHPLTPGSVAGVARRTTRRTIRRSTIYVTRLPAACVKTSINGTVLWHCGSTYYQPYGGRYVVVHIH
ncbi:MAG: hypothetical protein E5W15_04745 [Mesorhizobium sp.]|nr:hypothetical protein EJ068_25935 [Mesorhizobium sp. M2A.F.Ca.ET.043.02.1.1]RUW40090.1 hypothetical protein EOA37_16630 [Mesorhizobium sp. M2A.F.Ca.ET.015.02.1.1]RUW79954.1 hypothetical protein EOA28_06520 [Mesorhizobium sp. M2A.F.Ca.ET.067.02.1.1]RVC96017.1 hypothetical protein EN739_10650 [Mesorhizobium sp. M2A.F.Ca.ET.017.03.2.1]RVD11306.1 hypothetical protein EN753_03060 [Mesorhizobium sp. M2A.F.Ca.ET.029.05.1.1]RWB44393.1 MAG: hypothetical protein EOQ46_14510 [Mesorhizobium sp.]